MPNCYVPEDAQCGLDDAGEEGGGVEDLQVQLRVVVPRDLRLDDGRQQQRRRRHRPHRQVVGAPEHRVQQRRHEARI